MTSSHKKSKTHTTSAAKVSRMYVLLVLVVICRPLNAMQETTSDMHIYILMGQSNMAGRGTISDEYSSQGHPSVLMFDERGEWVAARHPLHFDKPKVAGVGPGLTFGMAMAEADSGAVIGLVPCAVGGTPIAKWAPGAYDESTDTHPYDDAVRRIEKALETGTIKGVIWHQGESDSDEAAAQVYLDKLGELIGRIRTVVGNPALPFVAGQLGRYRERYQWINNELAKLPATIPNTGVVSSEGLWHGGDGTHFDSPSAAEFGRRFAAGMLQLQEKAEGWEWLFHGGDPNVRWRSIAGDHFPANGWMVEDSMLVVLPGREGKDIITREQFSNFELVFDFKLTDSANTGVKYLVSPLKNSKGLTVLNGPEYQLIDDFTHETVKDNKSPETSTGSLYLLYAPGEKRLHAAGTWNKARIVVNGKHVEHWLNGEQILRYERGSADFRDRVADTKFKEYKTGSYGEAEFGHILLQAHGDKAYFKNIKIRRLK
ncbi:sialate O-acetylesterase [Parapedobacter sp. DT-150]|uniref:sialate O-acetylesterase n=1 Tax=Parapedobacter sp. DT-150 TaxID=3396162 RepID=UPI003F5417CF